MLGDGTAAGPAGRLRLRDVQDTCGRAVRPAPDQQAAFWWDVGAVARAVRDVVAARKVNYEIHGNTIEHLHAHLYPRHPGDAFTGRPIEGSSTISRRSPEDLARLRAGVGNALSRRWTWT